MLDSRNPQNFTRWFSHRLIAALRFFDVFTGQPVQAALRVTIPQLGLTAVHRTTNSTYRFVATEATVDTDVYQIEVEDPQGFYVNHVAVPLTLPAAAPTLIALPLWPTRQLRVAPGETAVIGRMVSDGGDPVDRLDVYLFPAGDSRTDVTFARTDQAGEFLFRMPEVPRDHHGELDLDPDRPRPTHIDVEVDRSGIPVSPVTPPTFQYEPGLLQFVTFHIP